MTECILPYVITTEQVLRCSKYIVYDDQSIDVSNSPSISKNHDYMTNLRFTNLKNVSKISIKANDSVIWSANVPEDTDTIECSEWKDLEAFPLCVLLYTHLNLDIIPRNKDLPVCVTFLYRGYFNPFSTINNISFKIHLVHKNADGTYISFREGTCRKVNTVDQNRVQCIKDTMARVTENTEDILCYVYTHDAHKLYEDEEIKAIVKSVSQLDFQTYPPCKNVIVHKDRFTDFCNLFNKKYKGTISNMGYITHLLEDETKECRNKIDSRMQKSIDFLLAPKDTEPVFLSMTEFQVRKNTEEFKTLIEDRLESVNQEIAINNGIKIIPPR